MVQYYKDEPYSFHLEYYDANQEHSNSTTLSSLHKQRIDTLFRSKRKANQRRSSNTSSRHFPRSSSISSQPSQTSRSEKDQLQRHSSAISVNGSSTERISRLTTDNKSQSIVSSPVSIKPNPTTIINVTSNSTHLQSHNHDISRERQQNLNLDSSTSPQRPRELSRSRQQVPDTPELQRTRSQSRTRLPSPGRNVNNISQNSSDVIIRQQTHPYSPAQEELEQVFGGKDQRQKAFLDTRTAVQAQIEKLFADAAKENSSKNQRIEVTEVPPPPPPPRAPDPPPPPPSLKTHPAFRNSSPSNSPASLKRNIPSPHSSGTGSACSTISRCSSPPSSHGSSHSSNMVYKVDYLGAIQLTGRATSLDVLQDPLKQLYYIHKFNVSKGKKPALSTLSITDAGLRICKSGSLREEVDFTNPFATIAVWAAIKMVIKKKISNHGQVNYSYAFLPLICDPEAQEKFNTYYPLNVADPTIMEGPHPPMFACVMRKIGETRILECHGFICRSSEDAIVIAANLYQALLGTMSHDGNNTSIDESDCVMSDGEITPRRPPRRRRTPPTSLQGTLRRASSEDMLRSCNSLDSFPSRLHRSTSDKNGLTIFEEQEHTAIKNKGPIPRCKSFANMPKATDAHNLFGDPKSKMVLGSIDDVLKAVINPKGMSFTEMDPQHRELLMKMALLLTKDEIYRRSKNIMRQRSRSNSISGGFESDSDASTITSVIKATKKSISRFGSRASNSLRPSYFKERIPLKRFNTHQGPLNLEVDNNISSNVKNTKEEKKSGDYSHMVNGSLSRKVPKTPMPKRNSSQSGYSTYSECDNDSECSSKCYCTLPLQNGSRKHDCSPSSLNSKSLSSLKKRSSCDCDSESCAESEKCYCSLKRIKKNGLQIYEINLDSETDTTITNGTLKRNKSRQSSRYGSQSNLSDVGTHSSTWKKSTPRNTDSSPILTDQSKSRSAGTIFSVNLETIKQRSNSSSIMSANSEKSTITNSNTSFHSERLNAARSSTRSRYNSRPRSRAQSTESVLRSSRRYRHPSGSLDSHGSGNSDSSSRSSPGLASQNSDGSAEGSTNSSSSQPKILLLSAVDPSGKVVYRGASQKKRRESSDTASILSMKKTAEIAALFSELKLNQKTDLINHLQGQVNASESEEELYEIMQDNQSFMFSDNIENSLGYLP